MELEAAPPREAPPAAVADATEAEADSLARELQAHLDEHGHGMSTQAHLTLSNYALQLHNRLTGALNADGDVEADHANRAGHSGPRSATASSHTDSFDAVLLPRHWRLPGVTRADQLASLRHQPPTPQERRLAEVVLSRDPAVYTSKAARIYVERELDRADYDYDCDDDSALEDDEHTDEVCKDRQDYVRETFYEATLTIEDVATAVYDDTPMLVASRLMWNAKAGDNTFWLDRVYLDDFKDTNPVPATRAEAIASGDVGIFYTGFRDDDAVTGSGMDGYLLLTPDLVELLKRVHRGALRRNARTAPAATAPVAAPAAPILRQTRIDDFVA